MLNKLVVTSSPHVRNRVSTTSIMLDVIVALLPAVVASTLIFGLRALLIICVSVVSCVVFEYLFRKLTKKDNTIGDLSAVVTGILLAFNLPSTISIPIVIVGAFIAIVVTKQLFGGIGQNFANPAIVARVALLVAFAQPMTNWVIPKVVNGGLDLVSGATPLAQIAGGDTANLPSLPDMLLGIRGGSLGETCIVALLIGGIYLVARKIIHPVIPVTYFGTVAVLSLCFGVDPLYELLGGGVVLGAIFMATDYTTSPVTTKGKFIFALGCGFITMVIRVYGAYPEGTSFAILLMNILCPHIDKLCKTKPFGGVKKA
ncbi:RnfABCDGE type electron transport complex subunit D [Candidatus Soleaferrea massiliensis]|uniref:RnfABCDGE type electron transport complex subunit D n=1 Tax=Candidatus Soleaferrea massiliensis TaxID=1470354 RepID=UPI00058FE397|nr:RnfABCDGE type electron transport complex subunit D [Candidatus Soleaferrea massiliensis]